MRTTLMVASALWATTLGGTARADEPVPGFIEDYGLSVSLGVGVMGFTERGLRDTTPDAGMWDVRVALGNHKRVGFEAAYLGGAQAFRPLGVDAGSAVLLSNAIESDVRINFFPGELQPFVFAGVAWKRYDLSDPDGEHPGVARSDNVLEWPFGAGIALQNGPLVFDLRWSYRVALDGELVPAGDGHQPMHAWSASASLGYELP